MVGTTVDMATRDSVPGLAAKLKAARETAGLSQVEAAERSGIHRVSIIRFESESKAPTLKTLYLLAAAYGVTVCDLLPAMPALADSKPAKAKRKKP